MPLNETQKKKFERWLNSKMTSQQCVVCSANQWQTGEIVMAPTFSGGGIHLGGPGVPMIQLLCTNCGQVVHFAAKAIGLA